MEVDDEAAFYPVSVRTLDARPLWNDCWELTAFDWVVLYEETAVTALWRWFFSTSTRPRLPC